MLDLAHIPLPWAGGADQQIFVGNSRITTGATMVWQKPRGVSMVHILCVGQGGDGVASVVGATSAGGAGGGSGGVSTLIIPATAIPDILYIAAGAGGKGTSVATKVSVSPCGATYNATATPALTLLDATGAIGLATTAGAVSGTSNCFLSARGVALFIAGIAGATGGAATGAVGGTAGTGAGNGYVGSGHGGGGMSAAGAFAGGGGTGIGGAAGTSGVKGGDGRSYRMTSHPLYYGKDPVPRNLGGGGGGTSFPTATISNPGNGGHGNYGCGGGGAGGAITGTIAGIAGEGGPGFAIISCW